MENIEQEYINTHEKMIKDHIDFLKRRNPPKSYIVRDLKSTYAGWLSDRKLAILVNKYIEMYS